MRSRFSPPKKGAPDDPAKPEEVAKDHEAVGSFGVARLSRALEDETEDAIGDLKYANAYANL